MKRMGTALSRSLGAVHKMLYPKRRPSAAPIAAVPHETTSLMTRPALRWTQSTAASLTWNRFVELEQMIYST